jgi:hypothetical protein
LTFAKAIKSLNCGHMKNRSGNKAQKKKQRPVNPPKKLKFTVATLDEESEKVPEDERLSDEAAEEAGWAPTYRGQYSDEEG